MPKKKIRVAIYARVSTDDQNPGMQLSELKKYAKARGFEVAGVYSEKISSREENRPRLQEMMADAGKRKFDTVLVWKFDRFARSTRELVMALERFQELGVGFLSLTENIDTSGPMGKLVFVIFSAIAEFERSLIGERVSAGIREAQKNGTRSGKAIGRPERELDDETLAKAKELRAAGVSWRGLSKAMEIPVSTLRDRMGGEA